MLFLLYQKTNFSKYVEFVVQTICWYLFIPIYSTHFLQYLNTLIKSNSGFTSTQNNIIQVKSMETCLKIHKQGMWSLTNSPNNLFISWRAGAITIKSSVSAIWFLFLVTLNRFNSVSVRKTLTQLYLSSW